MKPEPIERQRVPLPTSDEERKIRIKPVVIGLRSRLLVWVFRLVLKPLLARMIRGTPERIARTQLQLASRHCRNTHGLALDYLVLGRVPGHFLGHLTETDKPVVLWLHGGAFILPAVPDVHVRMVARICAEIGAVGFLPDYRLAPFNRFPAALDDCERAYRVLLDLGFKAERILIGGDSAGGNLCLGVLQRIAKAGLPMPAGVVPVSPVTEMGRVHAPPSRHTKSRRDPILPIASLQRVDDLYAGDWDASDPELSPLYADCTGFPPMYLLASDNEVLLDDTVLFARRAREAGVAVRFEVWPLLPHAFPLFEPMFPECAQARLDIVAFMREALERGEDSASI